MRAVTRLVRTAVLLAGPAVLAARAVRGLAGAPGRAATALRGSEREPVAGPLFAAPEPAVEPVPTFSAAPAPQPRAVEEAPVFASELPIASYDALNVRDASTAIKELTDPEQVRLVLRYEEENAKRTTVHKAARLHLESLEGASL